MKSKWLTLLAVAAMAVSLTACGNNADVDNPVSDNSADTGNQAITAKLSKDDAKTKALTHAGLSEDELNFINIDVEEDDGTPTFNVEFRASGTEYDYEIDGNTGEILEYNTDRNNMAVEEKRTSLGNAITIEEVTDIVLKDANLTTDGLTYLDIDLETEDGKGVYNVEFRHAESEYDYEVDAVSGEILESNQEAVND